MDHDPRDTVDWSSTSAEAAGTEPASRGGSKVGKQFLSLYFGCANAYGRAYKRADGSCYQGRCPKCAKTIDFPIGEGGTARRMFEVRCD